MSTKQKSNLDWKKLLGFKLAASQQSAGLTPANLAKVGSKAAGTKAGGTDT